MALVLSWLELVIFYTFKRGGIYVHFNPENLEISVARQSFQNCSALQKPYPWPKTNISYGKCRIKQILVKLAIFQTKCSISLMQTSLGLFGTRGYTLLHRTCKQNTVSIKSGLWPHTCMNVYWATGAGLNDEIDFRVIETITKLGPGPKYTLDASFNDAEIPHGVREEHVTC